MCGNDGMSTAAVLESLHLPACSHLFVGLYESCQGEQQHRTLKLEVWSPRWLLGARGRIKEEQKFLQSCFQSSEVKYSFGQ